MSFVALLVFIATILLSFDAIGAVKKLNIEQLTEQSTQIVNGRVVNLQSYWQKGKISTDVTIRVSSYILGAGPVEIVIPVPGGIVGEIAEVVSDVPHFELGQEVILFLRDEYFEVVGWYQGKFTVEDEIVVETGQEKSSFIEDIVAIESRLTVPPEKGQLDALIEAAYEVFDPTLYHKVEPALSTDEKSSVGDEGEEGVEREPNRAWSTIMSESFDIVDFPYSPWDVYAASGYTDAYWDDVSTDQDSDTKVNSGAWSCYCADEGDSYVWPPGPYPADMKTWMIYGPFSLADASDAELLFYVWSKTESDYDYFKYLASVNGTDFFGYEMSGDTATSCGGFCYRNFNLANVPTLGNLCGQSQVWIAFLFTSDSDLQYEGTYLDDLILRKDVTVPAPVINSINPTSGPAHAAELGSSNCASDSTLVTVNGSNFGATQGTSYVRFWRVGSTYINGCVTSWSDTQIKVRVPGRASSGNILVHTDTGGDSNTKYFTVTYSYGGGKWPGPSPMKDTNWTDQQYYYVNPNTTDTTGELAAVQASANSWNYVGNADFNFRYGGTTATAAVDFYDYKNVIFWNPNDTGSVATNHSWWYIAGKNTLIQFDIEFNDYSHTWATDGSTGKMDVQNVATHELGHSLQLLDVYGTADTEKTMYGYTSNGVTKQRTLHTDDIAGIHYIYPSAGTPAVFRVERESGNVYADGSFYGSSFEVGSADVAEWVSVSELVEPGDVLELDPDNPGYYRKSQTACSSLVAGVVSTQPGFVLGSEVQGSAMGVSDLTPDSRLWTDDSQFPTPDSALLALIGIVPVRVTDEGGPIQPGDLLVSSSTQGYAMRWDPQSGEACDLIGKALESLIEEVGEIQVLLMR